MSTVYHQSPRHAPSRYLSASTGSDGVRRYRVIYGGQPLCADKATLEEAWAVLKPYWPTTKATVDLWDGDVGEFQEIPTPTEVAA